jgi:methyl-accepting chemotaxis protein
MNLSREQLIIFSEGMVELADKASEEEAVTNKSIQVTNKVIIFFTLLGAVLALSILGFFFTLSTAIERSIDSMRGIEEQIVQLSEVIDEVSFSVKGMVFSMDVLPEIAQSVNSLGESTQKINHYLGEMEVETRQVAFDSGYIRYHTAQINQRFIYMNNAVGSISYSLHESAKPIQQFFPLP